MKTAIRNLIVPPVRFNLTLLGEGWRTLENQKRIVDCEPVDSARFQCISLMKFGETEPAHEHFRRLKAAGYVLHELPQFAGLWKDYKENGESSFLEHLCSERVISPIDFMGELLLSPENALFYARLERIGPAKWIWHFQSMQTFHDFSSRVAVSGKK